MQRVNKIISKSRLEGKSGEVRVFCMRIGGGGRGGGVADTSRSMYWKVPLARREKEEEEEKVVKRLER